MAGNAPRELTELRPEMVDRDLMRNGWLGLAGRVAHFTQVIQVRLPKSPPSEIFDCSERFSGVIVCLGVLRCECRRPDFSGINGGKILRKNDWSGGDGAIEGRLVGSLK